MTNSEEQQNKQPVESPAVAADVEGQNTANPATTASRNSPSGVSAITQRWSREERIQKCSLGLRGLTLLFSLLSFIIMASNQHGGWQNFNDYEAYRYLLGIGIIAALYTGAQTLRYLHEASTGKQLLDRRTSLFFDFAGDQVVAYLLISAASTAIPLTNGFRQNQDNIFTDSAASSISMAFFAFITLALAALVSGFKLSTQSYI